MEYKIVGDFLEQQGYTVHHPFILTFSFRLDSINKQLQQANHPLERN